ncbi:MAG: hypothetical protein R3E42_06890 [Burkholderiaceae bacterium]
MPTRLAQSLACAAGFSPVLSTLEQDDEFAELPCSKWCAPWPIARAAT